MALKFLNKKGWHTGSLRNIENVWKAEQKNDAEQKKLDELRKQIQEERERNEFRILQEQAGLVPRQERLDFLYDSGLAVGKSDGASASAGASGSGSGFKALEQPSSAAGAAVGTASKQQSSVPGALFEDKPFSASDSWRKLHSDPLLLIRQREQEALGRVKNNPVKMALIRKSIEEKKDKKKKNKHKERSGDKKERKKKHRSSSKHQKHSDSEYSSFSDGERPRKDGDYKSSRHEEHYQNKRSNSRELSERRDNKKNCYKDSNYREHSPSGFLESRSKKGGDRDSVKRNHERSKHEKYPYEDGTTYDVQDSKKRSHDRSKHQEKYPSEDQNNYDDGKKSYYASASANQSDSHYKRRPVAPKMSEEERAARLTEMQENAEMHEEQRWKRLKKAEEDDAREATRDGVVSGKNFLDAAQKSVYGAEKGGSSTIEERVRRRTYYSQGREASEGRAFRR